jgi:hypothetical protein
MCAAAGLRTTAGQCLGVPEVTVSPDVPATSADPQSGPARSLPSGRTLAVIFAFPVVVLAVALLVSSLADIPIDVITRDPLATAGAHPLTGLQSTIGVAIVWLAASVCFFTYGVLRSTGRGSSMATFLLWSGLLTALIAIDDQLQFHDDLIGRHVDIRERYLMIGAVALVLVYLFSFRRQILRTEWMLLGIAALMLAASIGLDYVSSVEYAAAGGWVDAASMLIFLEDGVKLLGITAWAAYFVRVSHRVLTDGFLAPPVPGALPDASRAG